MYSNVNIHKIVIVMSVLVCAISGAPQINFGSSSASNEVTDSDVLPKNRRIRDRDIYSSHEDILAAINDFRVGVTPEGIQSITFPDVEVITTPRLSRKQQLCQEVPTEQLNNFYYDSNSGKCFKTGSKEPCDYSENMVFGADESDQEEALGKCICKPNLDSDTPLIYHESSGQCFALFTQANCPQNQWLMYVKERDKPECQINSCNSDPGFTSVQQNKAAAAVILFNGVCVKLSESLPSCPRERVVGFEDGELSPSCVLTDSNYATGAISTSPKCPKGTTRSFKGKCLRNFQW